MYEDVLVATYWLFTAATLFAVAVACWRQRHRFPRAARLLLLAIAFRLLRFGMEAALSYGVISLSYSFTAENENVPDFADPETVRYLLWEIAATCLNLACWACIAWAALLRADEQRRYPSE